MRAKPDSSKWDDLEYCLEQVKHDGNNLQFVRNQTEEICLNAVAQNGLALYYVRDQTKKVCTVALNQNPKVIRYIDIDKYPELYEKYKSMMVD